MDFFLKASTIRLISYKDQYLVADEDAATITQGDDPTAANAVWSVEIVEGRNSVRLKSCHGTYLTASPAPIIPGVTGRKVIQTWPSQCDAAAEWEPSRDGMQVRLRSVYGLLLSSNGGLSPWRNMITHDVSYLGRATEERALWDVEVVQKCSPEQWMVSPSFKRSRSTSSLMDEAVDEAFYSNVKCWWYPKACMPF